MDREARERLRLLEAFERALDRSEAAGQGAVAQAGTDFGRAALRLAARLDRLFALSSPDAPGLHLVGAQFGMAAFIADSEARVSATGKGPDQLSAFLSCVGESVEQLSVQCWGDEPIVRCPAHLIADDPVRRGGLLALAGLPAEAQAGEISAVASRRLHDDALLQVPAALCYRQPVAQATPGPRIRLGLGSAAGPDPPTAALHGVLELVERDAIAMWWLGGRPAAPVDPDVMLEAGADGLLAQLRQGQTGRETWLLDLETDLGIPCVAALSCDGTGRNLAAGFAARLDAGEAVRAAILEMCQAEIEIYIVMLKRRQQGDGALNEIERQHLERCRTLDAGSCNFLRPGRTGAGRAGGFRATAGGPAERLRDLAVYLARRGVHVFLVDVSRPAVGIAAVRVLSADLQALPSSLTTPRLRAQCAETGGGPGLGNGISLI